MATTAKILHEVSNVVCHDGKTDTCMSKAPKRKPFKDCYMVLFCINTSRQQDETQIHRDNWLDDQFISDAQEHCHKRNKDFKAIFLLHNAPGHFYLLTSKHSINHLLVTQYNLLVAALGPGIHSIVKAKYLRDLYAEFQVVDDYR